MYLSLAPANDDPDAGFPLLRLLAAALLGDPSQQDKIGHFLAYAALAGTAIFGFSGRLRPAFLASLAAGYGLLFEGLQGFLPGRDPSAADIAANGSGVAAGWLAAIILTRLIPGESS